MCTHTCAGLELRFVNLGDVAVWVTGKKVWASRNLGNEEASPPVGWGLLFLKDGQGRGRGTEGLAPEGPWKSVPDPEEADRRTLRPS